FLGLVAIVSNCPDDFSSFEPGRLRQCMDEWQRHLLLLDVNTQGLADLLLTVVEQIVFNLEGHPDLFTETPHAVDSIAVGAGRACPPRTARRYERSRLLPDDVEIYFFGHIQAARLLDL